MLQSLSSVAMPSLLRVAAAGCVSASSHLHRLQHLATGPAAAVASAVQSPAQPPPYSQPISAATAATSEQKAKRPIKQPRWNERTQTGGLAVGSYTRRNRASALLVSFAPASVHTRRLLEHGDVVRLGSRAIQDYTALPAAGRAEGLSRQNPRYLGNYPELWSVPHHKLRDILRDPNDGYLARMGITPEEFNDRDSQQGYDLDHIIPGSLGGPDHARNLVVMPRSTNHRLGASLTAEKVQEVGLRTMLAAALFYVEYHASYIPDAPLQQQRLLVAAGVSPMHCLGSGWSLLQ